MSSVSSSGGGNDDSKVRSIREEYKKREAELIKKHNQELRKVSEGNQAEMERLRSQHDQKMTDMRERTKEAVTRRDAKYQKEIDEMRKLQTGQLERLMKENEQKVQAQRQASEMQVKESGKSEEAYRDEIHKQYADSIHQKEENMRAEVEKMREAQNDSMDQLKSNLNEKREKDLAAQKDYYDGRVSTLRNDVRTTRNSAAERLRNQEVRHLGDKQRIEENSMNEIHRRDKVFTDLFDTQRSEYKENLNEINERKMSMAEADRQKAYEQHAELERNVADRLDSRERRLENKLAEERARATSGEMKTKREAKREVAQWRDQYQNKFDKLEQARIDTLTEANREKSEDIKHVHKQASDAIASNNRYMQNQLDTEVFKAKVAIDSLEEQSGYREDYLKRESDRRVDHIRNESQKNEAGLRTKFQDNLDVLKADHQGEVQDIRLAMLTEKRESEKVLKDQIQKQTVISEREKQDLVSKYEKQIKDLNDQFVREKRSREMREKQLTQELQRGKEAEKDALRNQYEEKYKATVVQHNQEMKDVARRHKEQIDTIMSTAKKNEVT